MAMWPRSMLRADVLQCTLDGAEMHEVHASSEPWVTLHKAGVQFVIVDRGTHQSYNLAPGDAPHWMAVNEENITDQISVFTLSVPGGGARASKQCIEARPGVWEVVDTKGEAIVP